MEFTKQLWRGSLLLSEHILNEFWYLLDNLLDHSARLPLCLSLRQHMQQEVSPIGERLQTKLGLGHDHGCLERIFVSEDDFKVKLLDGHRSRDRSL